MRDATAEIAALTKQGIDLDPATEAAYRAEVDRINAATPAPKPAPKKKARKR